MTPQECARRLRRGAARLPLEADRALRDLAQESYRLALTYSSGRVRQAVFDAPLGSRRGRGGYLLSSYRHGAASGLGHPYGHGSTGASGPRGPIPYGDAAKVNAQGGDFFRAWRVVRSASGGWSLVNDSPHARFLLEGTRLMVRRPFLDHVADHARRRAAFYGAQALQSAFRN